MITLAPRPPAPARRGGLRVLAAFISLIVAMALAVAAPAAPAWAAGRHSGDLQLASNPDWMSGLPDGASLAALSIPGTHDTMAYQASIISLTQESALPVQLQAGVRMLDIRTRHYRDAFPIHHGAEYLRANFTDVVRSVAAFLAGHPRESVLMRLKQEHTAAENTRSYEQTLNWYINDNPDTRDLLRDHLWRPPAGYDGRIPTLGETRGRIVILQDFGSGHGYGPRWNGDRMDLQDDYQLPTLFHIPQKWNAARTQFEQAGAGAGGILYVNHLSASGGALPKSIAYGALGVTGMNERALTYLATGSVRRTGVVVADFPGPDLVNTIIARNL
ncbi:phosphatidylinositol-specific phospholipase C [Streptosporangium sp. NPDC006013]|uniref:phosphatidylinositol-specific phospholipase C n=1 Tax=Streptosporangium sp. NPDC006013 TaxID=3155596 RepID=UPI0033B57161